MFTCEESMSMRFYMVANERSVERTVLCCFIHTQVIDKTIKSEGKNKSALIAID